MVICAFCSKSIDTFFANGEVRVDTKYWRVDEPIKYFCDGYCATGLHEQERNDRKRKD